MKIINKHILTCGLLGCAVMSSVAGEPAPIIQPEPSGCGFRGSIGVTLGNTWLNSSSDEIGRTEEDEYLSGIVDLRLGVDLGSSFYTQLDFTGEMTDVDSNADDSFKDGWGVAGHFLWNYNDCFSLGVFGGWFETNHDNDNTNTSERYILGLEGLHEFDALDFRWQLGGLMGDGGTDQDGLESIRDAYFGRIVAVKDLGSGWSLSGEFSAAFGEMDSDDDDITIYGWGAGVQKQLTPNWVLAIVYQGNYYEQEDSASDTDDITEHFVGLNTTFAFGQGSAPEECAPTMDLPPVLRWMAITGGVLE